MTIHRDWADRTRPATIGTMDWRDRLTTSPDICHGRVCVKGTRIMVSVVLDNLAVGMSVDDVVASYPSLTRDDVFAALQYAAELARETIVPFAPANG